MIGVIADSIQFRLEAIGITITRTSDFEINLHFMVAENPYVICCNQCRAAIYDRQSLCAEYLYADPDFYARMIKRVRMITNPTSIWHVYQVGLSIGMPSILDE